MVKDLPTSAGDMGSIPDPGRSLMSWTTGPQLLSLCIRAWEPQLLSPRAAATKAHTPWSPCSATGEANCTERLMIATREQLQLSAAREKPEQRQRPSRAQNNKNKM